MVLELLCLRGVPCLHHFHQHQGYLVGLEVRWLLVCQPLREAQEDQYDPEEKENGRYEEVWKEGGEIKEK